MNKIITPADRAFYINGDRGRHVEIESKSRIGVSGFYTLRAIKPGFGVVREIEYEVPNLITNLGMDALGEERPSFQRMHLGTGTAPPQVENTSLNNFGVNVIGNNGTMEYGSGGSDPVNDPFYAWSRVTWTSNVGGATGNWTEIGISSQNTNGGLRSHALIRDSSGNPVSFPVQADEQFQGSYEFRIYPSISDYPASVSLSGTPYDTITRALGLGSGRWDARVTGQVSPFRATSDVGTFAYSGPGLVPVTATAVSGTSLGARNSYGNSAYGAGNHYLDTSHTWGSGHGVGDINLFQVALRGCFFQVLYEPTINKLATETLTINQRTSWERM